MGREQKERRKDLDSNEDNNYSKIILVKNTILLY